MEEGKYEEINKIDLTKQWTIEQVINNLEQVS